METNCWNLKKLNKIINIQAYYNIGAKEEFDYFRISAINNKKEEKQAKNLLFFPLLITENDCGGVGI